MRRIILIALLLAVALTAGLHWLKIMHFLGWDGQTSDYYAAWSSSIPAMITAVGYVSLVTALISKFNCHHHGCWRIGKHHVNGTPWCNLHHHEARPVRSERELLEAIETLLKDKL